MRILFVLFFLNLIFNVYAVQDLSLNGEAFVRGFSKGKLSKSDDAGFNHFLRIKTRIKADEFVTVNAAAVYTSANATGDFRSSTNSTSAHQLTQENVKFDTFSINYFKEGNYFTAGRMEVTSPGSFLTSDDRRDRFMYAKFFGQNSLIAIYDKRAEGTLSNREDDLDMYSLNYYGKMESMDYAIQTGYFYQKSKTSSNTLKLKDVKQVTPQFSYKTENLSTDFYYTYVGSGNGEAIYGDDHHSLALKLGTTYSKLTLEIMGVFVIDGGLVASGFDTLSTVINNSAFNYQSNVNLQNIGLASGNKNADEKMIMSKVGYIFSEDFKASIGVGHLENYSTTSSKLISNVIYDTTVNYKLTQSTSVDLKFGQLVGDNDRLASSVTLQTKF